jgi:hypothetical protein
MNSSASRLAPLAIATALLASGCASRIGPNDTPRIYVAENNVVTYWGESYTDINQIGKQLIKDGATPSTRIEIVPQGEVPDAYLANIASALGRQGLPKVLIREKRHVSAVVQKKGTGIEPPPPSKPPRVVRGRPDEGKHRLAEPPVIKSGKSF